MLAGTVSQTSEAIRGLREGTDAKGSDFLAIDELINRGQLRSRRPAGLLDNQGVLFNANSQSNFSKPFLDLDKDIRRSETDTQSIAFPSL